VNRALDPTQGHSTWRALLQNIELMPQYQDFRLQPPSRLEAVGQQADEKEGNCDHQPQSCSDSVAAATPADGVLGSDRLLVRFDERQDIVWRNDLSTGNATRNFTPALVRKEVETCGLCHARRGEFSEESDGTSNGYSGQ
jgi:hypothetical protein